MLNVQSQLNNRYIEQIRIFCNGSSDVLSFYAPSGTGKNGIVNTALLGLGGDFLRFYYCCNSLTVIEDFLLGFYDTLRDYTIQKKIVLKKDINSDFTTKVSNYMKAITKKVIIIVDNYEKVETNENINKFLSDISKSENIKLILLSRKAVSLMRFQLNNLKTVKLEKPIIEEDAVVRQISLACPMEDLESIRNLYKVSEANMVLIQTTVNYVNVTKTKIEALIEEFKRKNQSYEDFITGKILTLIPQNYMDSIKALSLTNFLTTTNYLSKYNLSDINSIPYLKQKLIVNQINQNVYEYEHIKNYLIHNLSPADKLQYGDMIINSLNQELSKSPKDRILRLSREGLRKQIESLQKSVPRVKANAPTSAEVSYYSQSQNISAPWLGQNSIYAAQKASDEAAKTKTQQDLDMLKQFRQNVIEQKIVNEAEVKINSKEELIKKIKIFEGKFDFQNAIYSLQELLKIDPEHENTIIEEIGENYFKLGKHDEALNCYIKVSDNYKNWNNMPKYFKALLKTADIRLKTYDLAGANKIYYKIINEDTNLSDKVEAYCALAKIEERKNNEDGALNNYQDALEYAMSGNLNEQASEIYYSIGAIYEKQNNTEEAKKNYQNSIKYGKNNSALADSYAGLASLLFDENNVQEAIQNYEIAITKYQQEFKPNASSLYTANTNLSYVYKAMNSAKEETYLREALKWAIVLKDPFEIASTHVALGDFYYNQSLNKRALFNYLRAQDMLNEDKNSQNQRMIASRIDDMRYKFGERFENIVEEYEQTKR